MSFWGVWGLGSSLKDFELFLRPPVQVDLDLGLGFEDLGECSGFSFGV